MGKSRASLTLVALLAAAESAHAATIAPTSAARFAEPPTAAPLKPVDALRLARIGRDNLDRPFRVRSVESADDAPQWRLNDRTSLWVDARRGVGAGASLRF